MLPHLSFLTLLFFPNFLAPILQYLWTQWLIKTLPLHGCLSFYGFSFRTSPFYVHGQNPPLRIAKLSPPPMNSFSSPTGSGLRGLSFPFFQRIVFFCLSSRETVKEAFFSLSHQTAIFPDWS